MRMRSLLAALIAVSLIVSAAGTHSLADTYGIDNAHSSVVFGVMHSDVNRVYGMFNEIDGHFAVDETGDIDLTIAANSVDTGNEQRDNHLRSPDFFNARQFANITFKSSEITRTGDGKYSVKGDVTLLGVTKPVTATLTTKTGSGRRGPIGGLMTTFTVKRSDFQLGPPRGLGDDVEITVSLQGGQQ